MCEVIHEESLLVSLGSCQLKILPHPADVTISMSSFVVLLNGFVVEPAFTLSMKSVYVGVSFHFAQIKLCIFD